MPFVSGLRLIQIRGRVLQPHFWMHLEMRGHLQAARISITHPLFRPSWLVTVCNSIWAYEPIIDVMCDMFVCSLWPQLTFVIFQASNLYAYIGFWIITKRTNTLFSNDPDSICYFSFFLCFLVALICSVSSLQLRKMLTEGGRKLNTLLYLLSIFSIHKQEKPWTQKMQGQVIAAQVRQVPKEFEARTTWTYLTSNCCLCARQAREFIFWNVMRMTNKALNIGRQL